MLWLASNLRYRARSPLADAQEGLRLLAERRSVVLITGRSDLARGLTERWLRRHGLDRYLAELCFNRTNLRSAQFKLHTLRERSIPEHIDDDGATALLLARQGIRRVYLRDWPGNRGLPYPQAVVRLLSLPAIAAYLE